MYQMTFSQNLGISLTYLTIYSYYYNYFERHAIYTRTSFFAFII